MLMLNICFRFLILIRYFEISHSACQVFGKITERFQGDGEKWVAHVIKQSLMEPPLKPL